VSGLVVRIPGRVFRPLAERAMKKTEMAIAAEERDDYDALAYLDLDLTEAIAGARIKNVGAGFSAFVQTEGPTQIERLLDWIGDGDSRDLRLFRDTIRAKLKALDAES
jgi:hypothetical protein